MGIIYTEISDFFGGEVEKMHCTSVEKWVMDKTGIEHRSREELRKYQLYKIKQSICYGKKYSRFYRKYLKNVDENKIKSFHDFENIPFTFPRHIENNPLDFLCVPQKCISRVVTLETSGTTADKKRIYFTKNDLKSTVQFFYYGMKAIVDGDDRVLILLPGSTYGSIGQLLKIALDKLGVKCFINGVIKNYEIVEKFIEDHDISCIVGMPIQVLKLSRIYPKIFLQNIDNVLLSTDYVPEILIRELSYRFGCHVFTHYGMTEMGYGGGVECENLDGYHLREADLYFEIIDPVSKKVLEPGNRGEVVFTTLTREGMPFVRYVTGDIASFKNGNCSCGTFLQTMSRVIGRKDNIIRFKDSSFIYMGDLDEIVLSFRKVMDYNISIDENRISIGINTFTKEDFYELRDRVFEMLQSIIPSYIAEITIYYLEDKIEAKNSIVKRKIYDCRKKVLK